MTRTTVPEQTDTGNPACRVQSEGATANLANWKEKRAWDAEVDEGWRVGTAAERERWEARARRTRRPPRAPLVSIGSEVIRQHDAARERAHRYASAKVRALSQRRSDVVQACGGRWRTIGCGCGRQVVAVGCEQTVLCGRCSRRHWFRWRRRITRGLRAHLEVERRAWRADPDRRGQLPGPYLITLTVPHTGDLACDREALATGWRALSKVAHAETWWRTYAWVYEITPGTDGTGHVHMHVAAISCWVPYVRLHEVWARVAPGACVLDVRAPTARSKAGRAAEYLAKYVSKGVQVGDMSGKKAAEWMVASRGRRRVATSVGFWRDPGCCPTCRRRYYLVQRPAGLDVRPAVVWDRRTYGQLLLERVPP